MPEIMLWTGSAWVKASGDTGNGLDVDVTRLPGSLTGKAEDAAASDGDAGVPILGVRNDSVVTRTSADGDYGMFAINSTGALITEITTGSKVNHATTGLGSGRKVVTTAGTRVALAGSTAAKWVTITAETDNTGYVVVGSAAGVIAALGTREGTPLAAGDSITLPVDNLADVGLDSTVSGDGATFAYGT